MVKSQPTMRAADLGYAARFSAFYVALSFLRFGRESKLPPQAANASRWAAELFRAAREMISETMSKYNRFHSVCKVFLLAILSALAFSACNSEAEPVQRLRITKSGSTSIKKLVVRFPNDNITFGDVPAGTTTEYEDVPNGVYSYAAYQFEVEGEIITQPVIDWMGENPMNGILFTYTLDFDPGRINTGDRIRLTDVNNDD